VLAVPVNQVGLFERFRLSETRAIPLDPSVPPEHALIAQPLGTVIFALKKVPHILDLDVAVVGQGPIGQLFNLALRNLGAREIIGIDLLEPRLRLSKEMGPQRTVCASKEDPVAAVKRNHRRGDARSGDRSGGHRDQALNLCIDLSRRGGKLLYFGVPPLRIHDVRWNDLFRKNLTIYTSVDPDFTRDFPLAMRWIGEGRVDVSKIITHRYPLAEIQTAFETFRDRKDGALKVLVKFPQRSDQVVAPASSRCVKNTGWKPVPPTVGRVIR